jgi:hypothetical protein
MLIPKLSEAEYALLEVIEDPIWLNEFLRSTNYGDMNKSNWPAEEFSFRPYQRELLTDQSPHIVVTGGRAIGKCQPAHARVYTTEGYKTITQLKKQPSFVTYGYSEETKTFTKRRAYIRRDKWKRCFHIKSATARDLIVTDAHPVLTPKGYVMAGHLRVGDLIATMNQLPTEHCQDTTMKWAEARALGYFSVNSLYVRSSGGIKPRFRKIEAELHAIAEDLYLQVRKLDDGRVYLDRLKASGVKHTVTQLRLELGLLKEEDRRVNRLDWLKTYSLPTIKAFIEAAFAQYGNLSLDRVSLKVTNRAYVEDWREILLYFGVSTTITKLADHTDERHDLDIDDSVWLLETATKRDARVFWGQFTLPGVAISEKAAEPMASEWFRWEPITEISITNRFNLTYSIHVYQDETYISENIVVHNSVILEDLLTYQVLNSNIEFPKTPEQLLVTPNTSQMTPLLDRLVLKFTTSPMLKDFLKNQINRSKGTLDFSMGARQHRLYARIAGSKEANNLVGLHIPKVCGDEFQLFSMSAFNQLQPTINTWESKVQEVYFGVPNGMRNMAIYVLDMKMAKFKKYRIPAPNNPYFTRDDWNDALAKFGGEDSDTFQQLILGRHGSPSFQLLSRDQMKTVPIDFYRYRYAQADKESGKSYRDALPVIKLPPHLDVVFSIDTGFSDPTIIQVLIRTETYWVCVRRYRIQRIDYPEQEQIIDYLVKAYLPSLVAVDVGAGGGGAGIIQSLKTRPEYAAMNYAKRILPVQFNEKVVLGAADEIEVSESFKSWGTGELVKNIYSGNLVFSEVDAEGISQLERLARQRRTSGAMHYFITSPRGFGETADDHIYASYLCFIAALREPKQAALVPSLARATSQFTQR